MLDNLSSHRDAGVDVIPLQATLLSSIHANSNSNDNSNSNSNVYSNSNVNSNVNVNVNSNSNVNGNVLQRRPSDSRLAVDVSRATIDNIVDELMMKVIIFFFLFCRSRVVCLKITVLRICLRSASSQC